MEHQSTADVCECCGSNGVLRGGVRDGRDHHHHDDVLNHFYGRPSNDHDDLHANDAFSHPIVSQRRTIYSLNAWKEYRVFSQEISCELYRVGRHFLKSCRQDTIFKNHDTVKPSVEIKDSGGLVGLIRTTPPAIGFEENLGGQGIHSRQ